MRIQSQASFSELDRMVAEGLIPLSESGQFMLNWLGWGHKSDFPGRR